MFRRNRIVRRSTRRMMRRMFHRMALADTDVIRIERETGQSAENLSEEQLLAAMKKLGIKKLELEAEE